MRPGISPELYGKHLLDAAAFIDLEDVAPWLPSYTELPDPVTMTNDLADGYRYLVRTLEAEAKAGATHGDMSVFAAWLQTGLGWPDKPADWPDIHHSRSGEVICKPKPVAPEADGLYPKERRLLEILEHERARGRKCAVFQTFTGRHDMLPRLEKITRARGFNPMVLRSEKVKPENREEWIAKGITAGHDVLICHPRVVETGLDLYAFPKIVWLNTGTSLFPVRQASRRSYRIGQTEPVEVRFLAYSDTLQTAQLLLMAKKLQAAAAAEGHITAEGLQILAGGSDSSLALAQALAHGMHGLKSAEELWARKARLQPIGAQTGAREAKIQTLSETAVMPVIAVEIKAKRGRVVEGVKALAIDFDKLCS